MTPVLGGRLQTRWFTTLVFAVPWTIAVAWLLPKPVGGTTAEMYELTLKMVLMLGLLGTGWELVYHGLQQLRWDKDWPSIFGLAAVVPEGLLLWYVGHWTGILPGTTDWSDAPLRDAFLIHVLTTWLVVWLSLQGPMRILAFRWRFEGGQVIPVRRPRDW